jgi:hypothetical protein
MRKASPPLLNVPDKYYNFSTNACDRIGMARCKCAVLDAADITGQSMNKYDGIGILHNQVLEKFGQTLVATVREKGASSITPKIQQKMFLDALQHALRDAPKHLPELAGAKVTLADIDRISAARRKAPKSPREAFGDLLPREAVRDLDLLLKSQRALGGRRIAGAFTALAGELEKKYGAKKETTATQTLLVSVAIARHSAEYWLNQTGSDDGWVGQLVRLLDDKSSPPRPGTVAGRLIDRIRKWFREHWEEVSADDAFFGGQGCLLGIIGGVPGILLGGLIGAAGGSILSACGML